MTTHPHPLIEELNEQKRIFQEKAQKIFSKEFKSFFEEFPEIAEIVWAQYTPYFNDGDPCEFSVQAPCAKMKYGAAMEPDVIEHYNESNDDEGYLYACVVRTIQNYTKSKYNPDQRERTQCEEELVAAFDRLSSLVQGMDEVMLDMFNDHVIVRATANGFDVEEYEHE